MAAKAFTGVGSADTGSNWTPTGVPSRTASGGDDVTFTTFPTGGAINAKTVTLPSVSANLSLVDFSNVGTLILAGVNYQNDNSIFLPDAGLVLAGSGGFGVDPTGVGGPTTPSLDPVAEIGPGNVLVGAGGTYAEPDPNAYSSIASPYGANGEVFGGLPSQVILDGDYGTMDADLVTTDAGGNLSTDDILSQGTGIAATGSYSVDNLSEELVFHDISWGPSDIRIGILAASNIGTVAGTDDLAPSNLKDGITVDDVTGTFTGGGGGGGSARARGGKISHLSQI